MSRQSWLEGDGNVVRQWSELDEVTQWWLEQQGRNGRPKQEVTDEMIAELRNTHWKNCYQGAKQGPESGFLMGVGN